MSALILSLMTWISVQSGYPVKAPPDIVFMTRDRVCQFAKFEPDHCATEGLGVMAAYWDSTVVIRQELDIMDVYTKSVLLHELVHHMQDTTMSWECRESEAYRLQEQWAQEQGKSVIDPLTLMAHAAACAGY